jgi:hypothetical protein
MFSLPHGSPNRAAVAPEIESRIEPNTLRFQCPNTGREIDSGINSPGALASSAFGSDAQSARASMIGKSPMRLLARSCQPTGGQMTPD